MALWLLNKCCTGPSRPGENPVYGHPCSCPESLLACVSESKNAELCGHNEFAGFESTPPKKYKIQTASGTRNLAIASPNACQGGSGGAPASQSRSTTLSGTQSYDENCDLTNNCEAEFSRSSPGCSFTYPDTGTTNERDPYNYNLTCDYTPDEVPVIGDITESSTCGSLSSGPGTWQINSAISKELPSPDNFENYTFTGAHLLELSSPDTEDDAIDRVEDSTEGSSCTAIREERVDGFVFNYTTVKYEAILTGLIPGFYYDGVVPTEKRAAVVDETYEESDWSSDTPIEIPKFRASKVFQLIGGGTLNVPDQDFIDQNYSLDPFDYPGTFPVDGSGDLVDPDAKVITPVTELIADSGEARRLLNPEITKWWSETERDRP